MIAGHETTAATLGFTLQMLGVHRSGSESPCFRAIHCNSETIFSNSVFPLH